MCMFKSKNMAFVITHEHPNFCLFMYGCYNENSIYFFFLFHLPIAVVDANVRFVETEIFVREDNDDDDVRLICLQLTTSSPLLEDVKFSVTSSDGTAMSFPTDLGKNVLRIGIELPQHNNESLVDNT